MIRKELFMESGAEVRLQDLKVNPSLQPRVGGTDAAHVRTLEEAPNSWPPLRVVLRGETSLLVDGYHRLEAAKKLGLESIRVEVVQVAPDEDLHELAFRLNATHGRPLSLADRRAFAERLLHAQP